MAAKTPTLKFLHLYPRLMDLYGDSGNLQILKYRAEQRGIKVVIDAHTVPSSSTPSNSHRVLQAPHSPQNPSHPLDFSSYDLIFIGGGSDKEQNVVARDILRHRSDLYEAYQRGVFFLAICGGFQLFGRSYKDAEGNLLRGLRFFDFDTEASLNKRERCIGNIVIETTLDGQTFPIVGFENHGGQTRGVQTPFGRVLVGQGNAFGDSTEGLMTPNFIGTYLHGPLLAKNPELADYILRACLGRRAEVPAAASTHSASKLPSNRPQTTTSSVEKPFSTRPSLAPLDDTFERQARQEMLDKLLSKHHVYAKMDV